MVRIVYYTPPSTPAAFFWLAVKGTGLAFVGVSLMYFLGTFLGGGTLNSGDNITLFTFMHDIFKPVTTPLFNAAGLTKLTVNETGLYTLYLLMQLPALLNVLPMMRLKMLQLTELDEQYGPVRKPEHYMWFAGAVFFAFGLVTIRYMPELEANNLVLVLGECARIMFVLVCALCSICFTVVGIRLLQSWRKSPNSVKLPGTAPSRPRKVKSKARGKLSIAIDNTKPGAGTVPSLAMDSDMGLYTALTAEVIQAAGRTKEAPTPASMLATLEMLQKAALFTRSGQYSHADLSGLCERTCNLFIQGQLTHLPDVKAAMALYKKPDPERLRAIAGELRALLEKPVLN